MSSSSSSPTPVSPEGHRKGTLRKTSAYCANDSQRVNEDGLQTSPLQANLMEVGLLGRLRPVASTEPPLPCQKHLRESSKQRAVISQLQESLTCTLCSELYTRPCFLSPCGHVACQNCLLKWFTASASAPVGQRPRRSEQVVNKTCPFCRVTVKDKPVEAWGMKDMVACLVRSGLAGSADRGDAGGRGQLDLLSGDPWNGIFGRS
ncbi:hypothetical protein JAAARDRAFT_375060 [Jaapia argillacea MUCL 33604]|uniref:RING-type domain-containing protein n=1 Tax=Jaapia argillacea MUCL 33604 TaxID=933084 RepID=A0A067QB15_9AGAM|nr:hypothetical protein JAAARDRAFT_375060 [Jaapia argillacea MUCL 33604]